MGLVFFSITQFPRYLEYYCLAQSDGRFSNVFDCFKNNVDLLSVSIHDFMASDGYISAAYSKNGKIAMNEKDFMFFKLKWS